LKIISSVGCWINIDNGEEWITYNFKSKDKIVTKKEKWPTYAKTLTAKWGYYPIDPPIEINSLDDIDDKIIKQIKDIVKDFKPFF